jgi:glutamine cyclotransferase
MMPRLLILFLAALVAATASATEQFGYKVIDRKPQSRGNFVQGLQILDDKLYVSAGGWGKSRLLRYDFNSEQLEVERKIDPRLWAEGLTILGDTLYLLTWKSRNLFVFSRDELKATGRMRIPGEGWGLTNDGKQLIYSDGSNRLYFVSPTEHRITRVLNIYKDGKAVNRLNELEWIDGRIWANVWETNLIVIIDPDNGEIQGIVNLQGLLPIMERRADTGVLNGIACNPADGAIWVTGKNWPWLYRIELVPGATSAAVPETESR